jgi:Kef-type K+ transport system membrane component KefB
MIAGFALGSTVFGVISPTWHTAIFPRSSLQALDALSQLGEVLLMFIVGAEMRVPFGVTKQLRSAIWIAGLALLIPMACGLLMAIPLYTRFAPAGANVHSFALFFASAVSITAFPVLARILKDRNETRTVVGQLSLSAAALIDIGSWLILALVVVETGSGHDMSHFWRVLGWLSVLILAMFTIVRPALGWLMRRFATDGRPSRSVLAVLLLGTFSCGYATLVLGIHPVFGAFLFGVCLPRDDRLLHVLVEQIEPIALLVLVPVFFALSGLQTTPDAFVGASFWSLIVIFAVSVAGKWIGGGLGAWISGQSLASSMAIGALMNARGLMELIVIKIGLDAGLVAPSLFTMLLVVAILTTMMAGPAMTMLRPQYAKEETGLVRQQQ